MDYPTLPIGFQTGHPLEGPGRYKTESHFHSAVLRDFTPALHPISGTTRSAGRMDGGVGVDRTREKVLKGESGATGPEGGQVATFVASLFLLYSGLASNPFFIARDGRFAVRRVRTRPIGWAGHQQFGRFVMLSSWKVPDCRDDGRPDANFMTQRTVRTTGDSPKDSP